LAHARVFRALDKSVKGYVIHPFGSELFATVDLENLK
jgi:hypothetical protein